MRKFDANKLYASEILAILMQSEPENVVRLSNLSGMDGVDMLLQVIAYYKRRVPSGLEEEECVENLFNALCAVMNDNNANREKFCKSEGFELMMRCMRERKHAAPCALRALDFATIDSPANCERLVEVLSGRVPARRASAHDETTNLASPDRWTQDRVSGVHGPRCGQTTRPSRWKEAKAWARREAYL